MWQAISEMQHVVADLTALSSDTHESSEQILHSKLKVTQGIYDAPLTFWGRNFFFLILAHTVYKMLIIQEPNTLELWNKLHFEEKKTEIIYRV